MLSPLVPLVPAVALALAALPLQVREIGRIQASGWDYDAQGRALALDGDRLLVGASFGRSFAVDGSAHLFERDRAAPSGWREAQRLEAPGYGTVDRFGDALDIEGDVIAVGAYQEDQARGAVYVFERPAGGGEYALTTRLAAPLARGGQWFGATLALDGGRLLVGAPRSNRPQDTYLDGRALLFERDASGAWVQADELLRPPPTDGRIVFFGSTVALEGDLALVATGSIDFSEWNEVHVFVHGTNGWEHRQVLTSNDVHGNPVLSLIGDALALSGDDLVMTDALAGTVHFFRREPDAAAPFRWVNSHAPRPPFSPWDSAVALSGDRAALGFIAAPWRGRSGTVLTFERDPASGTWGSNSVLPAIRAQATSVAFGSSLLFDDDALLVGDPALAGDGRKELGGVRVFADGPGPIAGER